jgi:hypothetical protein
VPLTLLLAVLGASSLDDGAKAVAEQSDDAVRLLERAKSEGPYAYAQHVRLYELLGIAYSYAERKADALKAFDLMLALEPGHAVSYKLSPKATFVFEDARKAAAARAVPGLDVQWPRDVDAAAPVPMDLSIIADPFGFLSRARVYWRLKGAADWESGEVALETGHSARLMLPAVSGATQDVERDVRVVALDSKGDEVLRWGSEQFPRAVVARYRPSRVWIAWVVGAVVVAAIAASTIIYFATRPPPDNFPTTITAVSQ